MGWHGNPPTIFHMKGMYNMNYNNTQKIVVLKDIPSNLIEEAILILKTDKDFTSKADNIPSSNDILINEANFILNNYINEFNDTKKSTQKSKRDINRIINISLIGSFLLLVFLLTTFLFF